MLYQGLRRGELLTLPTDTIKSGVDPAHHTERFWMDVKYNEYEDDPGTLGLALRTHPPSAK